MRLQTWQNGVLVSEIDVPDVPGEVTRRDIEDKLRAAIAANVAYLAKPSPTAGEVGAQVKLLTREVTGLLRLALGALDSADGT
jgi:hypothetical protein